MHDRAIGNDGVTPACERTRFLLMVLDDEERGRLQPVEHYVDAFPGLAQFVRSRMKRSVK